MKLQKILTLALAGALTLPVAAQYNAPIVTPAPQTVPMMAPVAQPAPIAPGPAVETPQQAKLMSRRAAIVDAQRQLAEMVMGVRIDSETVVRDFVTESDVIYTNLQTVIRGAQVTDTRYMPDGICEVDMEIPAHRIQGVLGRNFTYPYDAFRATGTGVPNAVAPAVAPIATPAPYDYTLLTITATGSGVAPARMMGTAQGYAMAKRAAQLDAYRNLGENVMGVRVDSDTYVRDFVTQSDEIRTRFNGFIKGARVTDVRELADGLVEVDMEIALDALGNILVLPSRATPRQPVNGGYGATGVGRQNPVVAPAMIAPQAAPQPATSAPSPTY